MATSKQPNTEPRSPKETRPTVRPMDLDLPQADLETPLYDREAEKARREAATEAFRNEKAHERPPRHQA
ncbi:hypothetical protein DSM21852_23190 [Methylocystis bryophila]|nr:hypothetical protein DSM21852_23190 [Methylocystis bryophila]